MREGARVYLPAPFQGGASSLLHSYEGAAKAGCLNTQALKRTHGGRTCAHLQSMDARRHAHPPLVCAQGNVSPLAMLCVRVLSFARSSPHTNTLTAWRRCWGGWPAAATSSTRYPTTPPGFSSLRRSCSCRATCRGPLSHVPDPWRCDPLGYNPTLRPGRY